MITFYVTIFVAGMIVGAAAFKTVEDLYNEREEQKWLREHELLCEDCREADGGHDDSTGA